jgi:hypothetical protein
VSGDQLNRANVSADAGRDRLPARIASAAEGALREQRYVSAIDVLNLLGWLPASAIDAWQQGRLPYLEAAIQTKPGKASTVLGLLRGWAEERGLNSSEVDYVARTRDRRRLRFSAGGDDAVERAYRTRWLSPQLTEKQVEKLEQRQSRPPDLVVIQPLKGLACSLCGEVRGIVIMEDSGPVCLSCADMDHLVFVAAGDATLSRRAKKASRLSAVVVRFSRSRKRYERQGILVEEEALERAESECLEDAEARERRRQRAAELRAGEDLALEARMAAEIGRLLPGCPPERAEAIAKRATLRGSGRVGRTAAGRDLDPEAITLAAVASIRHQDTDYDDLLESGVERAEARARVAPRVDRVLDRWRDG